MSKRLYLGVDNGLHGGFGVIIPEDGKRYAIDMPVITLKGPKKSRKELDYQVIRKFLFGLHTEGTLFVTIERAQAFPKQGGVSNFTTGWSSGNIHGMVVMLGVAYEVVSNQAIKSEYFKGVAGDTKVLAYKVASQLFPDIEFRSPKGSLKDGRCDALLLAEIGRRRHSGG